MEAPSQPQDVDQDEYENNLMQLMTSTKSLSYYENTGLRYLLPQIIAALIAAAFHIGNGTALAYSAIMIAQFAENGTDITTTNSENSWIASVVILATCSASLFSGLIMDSVGRLNTIKIAGVPGILGWSIIATAKNFSWIIVGRVFVGMAAAWGTSPALVYISEISSATIRMSLMSLGPTYVAIGMIVVYLGGWLLHWRTLAWICTLFMIVPCIMCCFIPESPAWLMSKGKNQRAQKSLEWIHRRQTQMSPKNETYAELYFNLLQEEQKKTQDKVTTKRDFTSILREFLKPTGYKPIFILTSLFFFHHYSGVYITMFYSISFIREAGTDIDAYIASIMIGVVRLVMSVVSLYSLKRFGRRTLLFVSCLGMSASMFIAGLYTKWIQEGQTTQLWVPVAALLMYVIFSTVGFLNIPAMLIAELFPQEIRGVGYSLTYSVYGTVMFGALQSYYVLDEVFGGAANLQWFFSAMCLGGLAYSYVFVPETKGVKLKDITNYFNKGCIYVGHKNMLDKNLPK